ncbi:MAG TPA: molybdopterin-dependent oxidoreductase [Candidatus Binatia bacterium]|nr:molybdopterin-dependent oxidoreductase [Candidatus Binatia bacterium]
MSDRLRCQPEVPVRAGSGVVMDPATTVRRLVPVSRLAAWLTPTEDVYVVAHMGIAHIDVGRWRLAVDGLVDRPLAFDYESITRLPAREVTAVLECFGNPVEPDVPTRRVGNVVWRGVPLADVLAMAGVQPGAELVWLEGLDWGTFANVTSDRYVKDIPLRRALEPDVLLAWAMNGEPLTAEHGFPLRAVIPGYFGTNAVKWLARVHVACERPESLFTTRLYNRRVVVGDRVVREPVRELDVHAVIVRPADGSVLSREPQVVRGWAWGAWPVTRVEVSVDGGGLWHAAHLDERDPEHAWQAFAFEWTPDRPGPYELRCRATDAHGRVQPPTGRNRIHAVTVTVR